MSFPEFYAALKASNPIWWDSLKVSFPHRDYDGLAKQCWSWLLSCNRLPPKTEDDWKNLRASYQKFLVFAPEIHTVQTGQKWEEPKKEEEPVKGEKMQAYIDQILGIIAKSPTLNYRPRLTEKEKAEEGGFRPKGEKYAPYPTDTPEQVRAKEMHIAWIKHCYDPKTGEPNENWIEEKEFNRLYDNNLI